MDIPVVLLWQLADIIPITVWYHVQHYVDVAPTSRAYQQINSGLSTKVGSMLGQHCPTLKRLWKNVQGLLVIDMSRFSLILCVDYMLAFTTKTCVTTNKMIVVYNSSESKI